MDFYEYFAKYIIPILERKKIVLIFTLVGIILSFPATFIIKPEYVTVATVFVEEPYYQSRKIWENTLAPKQPTQGYVEMEARRIQGASFVLEVVKSLPKDVREKLKAPYTTEEQLMAFFEKKLSNIFGEDSKIVQFLKKKRRKSIYNLVFQVMNRVSVHFDKQSGLIYLTAKTLRPEIGPVLLKTYLDIWIAQNLEENKESARAQTRFAKELRDKAYLAYVKAQKELTEFRKRYQIPGGIKVTRDVDLMLEQNNLEAKVEAAKQRLKETNDLYTNAKMAEAGITSNIKIVQYPEFPVKKTMIKSIKLIIATIVIFFGLGIGVSLGLEFLEGKIRIKSDIEDTIGISVIGQIAKIEE